MNKTKDLSDPSFWRAITWFLKPAVLALGAIAVLYGLIFWSINKGVSIDEGYYLLGYLEGQQLGPNTSDFHRIIRSVFFFILDDNVLMFRWVRIILTICLLFLFLGSAYAWLVKKNGAIISKTMFFILGILSGTMCFSYASPVIYYDNLQLMIYLFCFSLFFIGGSSNNTVLKHAIYAILGFILVFGLINYPPSGMLLIVIILVLIGIYESPGIKNTGLSWLFIAMGFILGLIVYSIWIHDARSFFEEAIWAFNNSAKSAMAKYDTDGQLLVIGKYLLGMLRVYVPIAGLAAVYFLLIYKTNVNRYVLNVLFGVILLLTAYKFSSYFSNILLLPVILLFADAVIQMIGKKQGFRMSKNRYFVLILIVLPVMAVAGSNQRLEMKIMYFMPFWFLAYFILLAEIKRYLLPWQVNIWHTVFIIVFFVVFSAQGFIKHIHYNYSIKRSKYLIENAERFTNIGVSEYQCNFYENGIRELKKAGFKPGDKVLSFFETFMLVYAAGGYVPHSLTYSAEFFVNSASNIPPEKSNYIIIDEYQVPMMTEFLASTDWDFPTSYQIVELGTDGHNLTQLGYNYLLFYSKAPWGHRPQTN